MSLKYILLFLVILGPIAFAARSLAPWVPTRKKDLQRIHTLAALQKGSTFYDLGCGEGRVCRYIAKHNPEAMVVGIEMAIPLYLVARLRQILRPQKNLTFVFGDALKKDLSKADCIYAYALIKTMNEKVKPKLLQEMASKSRILSYHFPIYDWPGEAQEDRPSKEDAKIFVYDVP